jgi:hypothetical protein
MLDATMADGTWIGHLFLRPEGAAAAINSDVVTVDLNDLEVDTASLLALRLLSPLAALPAARRTGLRVLLAGQTSELLANSCRALGCAMVRHWLQGEVSADTSFHRVLYGCGGNDPDLSELSPLIAHLRQDGQLGLFDLPAASLPRVQNELAEHGFSVRAAGTEQMFGFLAGSIENPKQFSA